MNQHDTALSLYNQLLDAWNSRDADAYASLFADEGNAVGFDGSQLDGRPGIASEIRRIFEHHKTAAYIARVREVRELAAGVVLVRAVAGMVPPGQSELNPAVNAIQSIIVVHTGGGPKIALLHNTPAAFHGRPELAHQLTEELTDVLRSGQTVRRI
jgi:uncharacterized protein (TIGR02246 family)